MIKGQRGVGADICWVILNLRTVWTILSFGMRSENDWRPDIALSLAGNTKYFWTTVAHIINELSNISYHLKANLKDRAALEEFIHTKHTPALHLLLCSLPRRILRFFCGVIHKQYLATTKKLSALRPPDQTPPKDTPQLRQWQQFMNIYKQCPLLALTLHEKSPFDAWLMRIDQSVAECYGTTSRDERQKIEAGMLVRGTVPQLLMPAVSVIFETLEGLQRFYDPGQLYRFDTSSLGLALQPSSGSSGAGGPAAAAAVAGGKRKRTYDVIKKTELVSHTPIKMCPRCGSVTEEYEPGDAMPFWLQMHAKLCACGVLWAVASGDGGEERDAKTVKMG
jgi:hypothetical protein